MTRLLKILKLVFDFVGLVKAVFGFGTAVTEKATQREALKNAADVKTAAIGVDDQKVADDAAKAIREGNLDEIRRQQAE